MPDVVTNLNRFFQPSLLDFEQQEYFALRIFGQSFLATINLLDYRVHWNTDKSAKSSPYDYVRSFQT